MFENIGLFSYVPVVGDLYDIEHGSKKMFDPNLGFKDRALGASQAALGVGGLATLGIGSLGKPVAKLALKGGANYIAKHGVKKAMNKAAQEAAIRSGKNPLMVKAGAYFANKPYEKSIKLAERNKSLQNFLDTYPFFGKATAIPYGAIEATRIGYDLMKGNGTASNRDITQNGTDNESTETNTNRYGSNNGNAYIGGSGNIRQLTPQQIQNTIDTTKNNRNAISTTEDPRALYYDYMIKQQAMQPYRDELNNYIRDYQRYSDWSYNQDKYLALLSSLSGAQGLRDMIGKNTAIGDEEKLAGLKKVQGEDLKNVGDEYDKLIGDVALAKYLGLPLDSVNASDDMVRLAVAKEMSDDKLENALIKQQALITSRFELMQAGERLKAALRRGDGKAVSNAQNQVKYWNAINRQIENGANPQDAINWGNKTFGTNFTVPPTTSLNSGGKILPM